MYYNDLRIIIDVTYMYFTQITLNFMIEIGIYTARLETTFGITCSNCSLKLLSDLAVKIGILETSNIHFRAILILELIWPGS